MLDAEHIKILDPVHVTHLLDYVKSMKWLFIHFVVAPVVSHVNALVSVHYVHTPDFK